jgi:FtsZ-binding cell division protein ZapB
LRQTGVYREREREREREGEREREQGREWRERVRAMMGLWEVLTGV